MNILQINSTDQYGGAEAIMNLLVEGLLERDIGCRRLIGRLHGEPQPDLDFFQHDEKRSFWSRKWLSVSQKIWDGFGHSVHGRGISRFVRDWVGQPVRSLRKELGHEDFDFPDTIGAIERQKPVPDLLHIHSLHSSYFDLRALEALSRRWPVVITLHDAWMITGHCSHPGECERFQRGCGDCPDLERFPAVKRDATAFNFRRKSGIYARSPLHVVTPSRWLMGLVEASPMHHHFRSRTVIPNGIDLNRFSPPEKECKRAEGHPLRALFVARNATTSPFKDFSTVLEGLCRFSRDQKRPVHLKVFGEEREPICSGDVRVEFSLVSGEDEMLRGYHEADFLIHLSKSENYPTVVMEAMACGLPVIVSDTGGMREQIRPERIEGLEPIPGVTYAREGCADGLLVRKESPEEVARALDCLFGRDDRAVSMGTRARMSAEERFSKEKMVQQYLDLYQRISKQHYEESL